MKRLFITIYIVLIAGLLSITHVVSPILDEIFKDEIVNLERDYARGTFSLIAEKLVGLDEASQDRELEKLKPEFGYPIRLYKLGELQIDDEDQESFINGRIIYAREVGVKKKDSDMLVQRLEGSDRIFSMGGPFPGGNLDSRVTIIFLGLMIILLTLPALAWTFFLHRDIKKIEKTTTQFAIGDHKSRVRVSRISSMAEIASAFNNMAKKTQKLVESQKELGNSVSHEIRTPLARIKFSMEMLLDYVKPDHGGEKYLGEIGKDVEEIESLVDEMLTYAKFEREPDTSEELSKHEIVSWLKNIIKTEQNSLFNIKIGFKADPETDKFITNFEPVYLGWAVRNLIRNASKYARKNIDIVFEPGEERCTIHIDDDGPGVPESERQKVFEPFVRLDKSRSKESGGYGLGLAIAKRVALWHKGSISVGESSLKGARFTIDLPRIK